MDEPSNWRKGVLSGFFGIGLMMAAVGFLVSIIASQTYELWYARVDSDAGKHPLSIVCTIGIATCLGGFVTAFVFGTGWAIQCMVTGFLTSRSNTQEHPLDS